MQAQWECGRCGVINSPSETLCQKCRFPAHPNATEARLLFFTESWVGVFLVPAGSVLLAWLLFKVLITHAAILCLVMIGVLLAIVWASRRKRKQLVAGLWAILMFVEVYVAHNIFP
jgi:hypothetical protein